MTSRDGDIVSDREDSFRSAEPLRDARFGRAIREVEGSPSAARLELLRARIAAATIARSRANVSARGLSG